MEKVIKNCSFILFSLLLFNAGFAQIQIGTDLIGEQEGATYGDALAISKDGLTIAVGAPLFTGDAAQTGEVKIYHWDGIDWEQRGSTLSGNDFLDRFGRSLSFSDNGEVLAIGGAAITGSIPGFVEVYAWEENDWVLLGERIEHQNVVENFGAEVALSANGQILAVGAPNNDTQGTDAGQVRIYEWNGSAWQQLGEDLNADSFGYEFGIALALSNNGETLAIGAPGNSEGFGFDFGEVKVYKWSGSTWQQLGEDINGPGALDEFGISIDLSGDGTRMIVGAPSAQENPFGARYAKVLDWNGQSWDQVGEDLEHDYVYPGSGIEVQISDNGQRIVVASPFSIFNSVTGYVRIYDWINNTWQQSGVQILGDDGLDNFGTALSLSGNGGFVAIGGPNHQELGQVKVFELDNTSSVLTLDSQSFSLHPNPTSDWIHLDGFEVDAIEVYNQQGIRVLQLQGEVSKVDLSALPFGGYYIRLHRQNQVWTVKVLRK